MAGGDATTSTCRSRSTARPPRSTTRVRGAGSYATAIARDGAPRRRGLRGLQDLGRRHARERRRSSTRSRRSPTRYGAQLRLTRLRPSGRGADVWDELHPTAAQQRELYDWLLAHGEEVLTGDSFFHLAAYGEPLPGLNLCGAGRVVCLIDPVGDVYACPFAIHDDVPGRQRPRRRRLRARVARVGAVPRRCASRRRAGACASLRHVRRLPRRLHGGEVLHRPAARRPRPGVRARPRRGALAAPATRPRRASSVDHSRRPPPDRRAASPAAATSRRRADGDWFESVAEAQRRARRRAARARSTTRSSPARSAALTLQDNLDAFGELGFAPHVAGLLGASATLATTVMGQPISLPVLISPTGVQAVHPDGEVAVARAAAARGTAMGLSSFAQQADRGGRRRQPADVLPALLGGLAGARSRRASSAPARAGAVGAHRHARLDVLARARLGQPDDPERARPQDDGQARARGARCGRGGCATGRAPGGLPDLDGARTWRRRARRRRSSAPTASGCRRRRRPGTTSRWLREQWDGPVHAQGRHARRRRPARGRRVGADARSRSPTTAATTSTARRRRSARCPRSPRRSATRSRSLLDGGIRRGSDVVKALALGARAVMIGRAYLWGLAANGQAGVENVLDILRDGHRLRAARARPRLDRTTSTPPTC